MKMFVSLFSRECDFLLDFDLFEWNGMWVDFCLFLFSVGGVKGARAVAEAEATWRLKSWLSCCLTHRWSQGPREEEPGGPATRQSSRITGGNRQTSLRACLCAWAASHSPHHLPNWHSLTHWLAWPVSWHGAQAAPPDRLYPPSLSPTHSLTPPCATSNQHETDAHHTHHIQNTLSLFSHSLNWLLYLLFTKLEIN